ncbi:uncharacterized protein LOC107222313 isoform X1 [Neodiprion lecontei]|uniref:hydroxyisourate hydrolase n=1 Tax=Neodiprion lecontei TaxID=441921 RepID=A0A6J0BQS4_NEOLC|nr:uncharacterized protein LOC107222313 isoform X1 [Neodiprion lecontei]
MNRGSFELSRIVKSEKSGSPKREEILHLQLTPTGKISHAKTRVYTQRYRKAWEQMPDFKGWLTAVPDQPTRAYCTYCKKNLHAHRLSLLKHTCTMKHQRGAMVHQKEAMAKDETAKVKNSTAKVRLQKKLSRQVYEHGRNFKIEEATTEDDDEDIEYVIERLDDDLEMTELDPKNMDTEVEHEEAEENENQSVPKKMKMEVEENSRPDALAEAMAHVHGEFLDENGDPINVELEMVVESADPCAEEVESRVVSARSNRNNGDGDDMTVESLTVNNDPTHYVHDQSKENDHDTENPNNDPIGNISSSKSSLAGEWSDVESDESEHPDIGYVHNSPTTSPPTLHVRKECVTKPSTGLTISESAASITSGTAVPLSKKTVTLTPGGKTVILDTSAATSYAAGSRYVISTAKGQASAVVVGDKKKRVPEPVEQNKIGQHQQNSAPSTPPTCSVSGGTQTGPKKHIILKPVTPLVQTKKPCISTHVLDTSKGLPVGGLQISLYKLMDGRWTFVNESNTSVDGRCADLVDISKYSFTAGRYKLHFDVDKYFTLRRIETMYPFIEIVFDVKNPTEHYHVPLLMSPFGYTTYRGT